MKIVFNRCIKLVFGLALVSFSGTIYSQKQVKSSKKPNIIYILADDLGYGDVKCFNSNGKIPTPNIDTMAVNGVMFTEAHTSSAVCTPTRYGILTGRYNWRSTLKSSVLSGYSKSLIAEDRTTVASMLKKQGYTTAYIGKWHMGWDWDMKKEDSTLIKNDDNDSEPNKSAKKLEDLNLRPNVDFSKPIKNGPMSHGFDYSFGFCGSLDMPPYVFVENGMPTMVPTKSTVGVTGFWRKGPTSDDFVHDNILQEITDKAIGYIQQKANKEVPFFLYLPLPAPHTPILPTKDFLGKSNTNLYGDFVMQVDDVVRQIRETLQRQGISENTLVVFTSDNGCSPSAKFDELVKVNHNPSYVFRGEKSDIYDGGHHVPFIVEWPSKGLKNSKSDKTICTTDFFATCAAISGYKIKDNEAEDSFSMLPLITGKNKGEIRKYIVYHSIDGAFGIKSGDWKLCATAGSGGWSYPTSKDLKNEKLKLPSMQLFNMKEDIGETKNRIAENPKKAAALKAALKKIILDGRSTAGKAQTNEGMEGWQQIKPIVN